MKNDLQVFEHVLSELSKGKVRPRGKNVELRCPACGREGKFAVNVYTGRHACFSCDGAAGSIGREITRSKVVWGPVSRMVEEGTGGGGRKGLALSREGISLPLWTAEAISVPLRPGDKGRPLPSLIARAREYALSRGVTPDQIRKYRMSVVNMVNRVYLPYWETDGRLTFYVGRALSDTVNPKTIEPGTAKPLFGLHVEPFPEQIAGTTMGLVEGFFDHVATPRSFALMGSTMSSLQLEQIKSLRPSGVLVMMDPDAKPKALKIAETLIFHGVPAGVVVLPGSADPSSTGRSRMEKIVDQLGRQITDRLQVWVIRNP